MVKLLPWNCAVSLVDDSDKENMGFFSDNAQKYFKDLRNGNVSVPLHRQIKIINSATYYHCSAGSA